MNIPPRPSGAPRGLEGVAQKIERPHRKLLPASCCWAVHDPGRLGVPPQSDLCQPVGQRLAHLVGLTLGDAVHHDVIDVPLEEHGRKAAAPSRRRGRSARTGWPQPGLTAKPCGVPRRRAARVPSASCNGAVNPPRHIQPHPRLAGVLGHSLEHQPVVFFVEELGDIDLHHPGPLPAAPPTLYAAASRAERPRAVAVELREDRLDPCLQPPWLPPWGRPAPLPWGLSAPAHHRWAWVSPQPVPAAGKKAPRRHPVPDLVQVPPQICLELLQRAPVHPRCALVRLDPQIRSHTSRLGNVKRFP